MPTTDPSIPIPPPDLPVRPASESRILVVDDDERIVDIFAFILSRDGYQVLTATDGFAALNLIEREHPDVIVLDVLLPGIDGIEICRRIKSSESTRFLPVILVTALSARASRHEGLSAGADDFLQKPPDTVELTVRVRSLLRAKQLHEELEAHRRELEERVADRTQQLQQAYQRLQDLSRVKDNVLSIVSHELRTPLHQAKIALSLALQDGIEEERRASLLREAHDAFGVLEYRVGDIEAFSDPTGIKLMPASTRDLLAGAVEQMRALRRTQADIVELDVAQGLPPVMVNPNAMSRALAHLILNAVKFGNGKPISVRAHPDDSGAVTVVIEDQGDGINPEQLPQLLEPLVQMDASSTRQHGGLGIGLALVKMILDAHQVPFTIEPRQDHGTVVTLRLPRAEMDAWYSRGDSL